MHLFLSVWPPERQPEQIVGMSSLMVSNQSPLRLRILLSYWYYRDIDVDALLSTHFLEPYPEIFADSGAFSAQTQRVQIPLDAYMLWIRRWEHRFTTYANLDVIGHWQATAAHQATMEAADLAPLPVFHVGEPWPVLEGLLERYRYIALGGLVPHLRYTDRVMPWLIKAFRLAKDRAVYHGFGVTNWEILKALPWYSVDSSSWGAGFRYGQVPLFDRQRGRFVTVSLRNYRDCYRAAVLIRALGFDPEDFADHARYDRAKVSALSALSFLAAEAWLRQRHGEIRLPAQPSPGPKISLVMAPSANSTMGPTSLAAGVNAVGSRLYLVDTSGGRTDGKQYFPGLAQTYLDQRGLKTFLVDCPRKDGGSDVSWALRGMPHDHMRDICTSSVC
jgi:hypothetical protein